MNKLADPEDYLDDFFRDIDARIGNMRNLAEMAGINPSYSNRFYSWGYAKAIKGIIDLHKEVGRDLTILDIGTCRSLFPFMIAQFGKVTTFDKSWVKERQKLYFSNPNIRVEWGSAEALPYENNSFDVITCMFALTTFADPFKALYEMRRVLTPNGKIYLVFDFIDELSNLTMEKSGKTFTMKEVTDIVSIFLPIGPVNYQMQPKNRVVNNEYSFAFMELGK